MLFWALATIAKRPEIQQKLYEEATQVFGDDGGVPTMAHIERLAYTELVIKEVHRLYPSAPAYLRNTGVDLDIGQFFFIFELMSY